MTSEPRTAQPGAAQPQPAQSDTAPAESTERQTDRVDERAQLLPEELAAGSDDPIAQAQQILAESDDRVEHPEGTRADSTQTPGTGS